MPTSSGGRGANSNSCVPRLGRVIRGIRRKIAGNPRLTERFADLLALAVRARFSAREIAPSRVHGPPLPSSSACTADHSSYWGDRVVVDQVVVLPAAGSVSVVVFVCVLPVTPCR